MRQFWNKFAALTLVLALSLSLATAPALALTADQLKALLQEHYLNDIPAAALEADTVEGVIDALGDPYTAYMDAEQYAAFTATMEDQTTVGIGISALTHEKGLLVVGVYKDTPAEKLGLVPGDIIVAVEGNDAAGQQPEIITGWLKGEEGTSVTFTVLREDGTEQTFTTNRATVIIPATTTEMLDDGTTAYISCTTFGQDTLGYFVEGTEAYDDADLWVVDLRNNGGGDVYAVTQSLGVFLGTGTMVYLRDNQGDFYRYVSAQDNTTIHPAITLVSPLTASAAEIFSLAMKDQGGGMVIGSHTYGKGVAQVILTGEQEPEALTDDALRITAFQYYGTGGSSAQNIGVVPDLLVDPDHADEIALLFCPREPVGDKSGWLRLHLGGWRWYLDIDAAMTAENAPYFGEMLSALPPEAVILAGTAEGQWVDTTAQEVAVQYAVPNYVPRVFTDVEGLDCATAANTLRTYEMLLGYDDGTYRPNESLTRAELCALLCQAMGLRAAEDYPLFSDTPADAWYTPYVQAACAAGYLEGVGWGRFDPEGTVTHQQLITVLGRLAAELNMNFYLASQSVPEDTGVPAGYAHWAQPWAWLLALSQTNILGQPLSMLPDTLENTDPNGAATRGDTAQILYTILTATEVIKY